MTQENPNPIPPPSPGQDTTLGPPAPIANPPAIVRTLRRILAEAAFVALLGALVFGISAEMHVLNVGFIIAVVIWIGGTPTLEVLRVMQSRR